MKTLVFNGQELREDSFVNEFGKDRLSEGFAWSVVELFARGEQAIFFLSFFLLGTTVVRVLSVAWGLLSLRDWLRPLLRGT